MRVRQARCSACGWHSYPERNVPTVERWAKHHDAHCLIARAADVAVIEFEE